MAITKNGGRQYPLVARVDFTFADFDAGAVTASTIFEAMDMPANAIVTGGALVVTTAFVGTTAATADVGDGGDPDRYSASPIDLMTLGRTALTLTGYKNTAADTIDMDVILTVAAATAGAGYLEVQYVIADRANEVQPV